MTVIGGKVTRYDRNVIIELLKSVLLLRMIPQDSATENIRGGPVKISVHLRVESKGKV